MIDTAALQPLIEPVVTAHGFALVRLKAMGGSGTPTLQVMAEDPATGQMTLDQCAKLSRALSAMLDETDPIESEYRLEVSSPGIDRPLTRAADWERWAGHAARVELADGVTTEAGTRKRFTGVVRGVDGEDALLDAEGLGDIRLPLSGIASAKLVLTDALIAATVPLSTEGADEVEDDDAADAVATPSDEIDGLSPAASPAVANDNPSERG